MTDSFWLEIAGLGVLLVASAFFSGSETALTAASRARMHTLESDGDKRAKLVNSMREKKEKLIGALLLGNTLVNVLAGSLATTLAIDSFGKEYVLAATGIVSALMIVFSEVMPKTYALIHPDRVALFMAPMVAPVVAVFSPVTHTIASIVNGFFRVLGISKDGHSVEAQEEELRGAIELLSDEEDDDENGQAKKAMLKSILDLVEVKVEKIMVHRKNVLMANADLPAAKLVDEVLNSTFTRLPIWRESPDNIVGVIHTKLLLQALRNCGGDVSKVNIESAMLDPWFIPESTTLFDQLQAFRARREHFAIMVDEYGALMGVITLEDILEEIVGQIDDEHDTAVTGVRPQPDGSFIVDGKVTIRDLNREMDWGLPDEEYSTVAGLVLYESQRIPAVGQTFTFFSFRFEVVKKQRNQVTVLRVTPPPQVMSEEGLERVYEVGT